MRFEVLGPLRLGHEPAAAADPALSGRLQQVLLGVLLARANQPVSVDTLVDALWPDQPHGRALHRLQYHVHRLRRLLDDPARLEFGPGGYRLRVWPGELDAERFALLVEEGIDAGRNDPVRGARLLRDGLELWRGRPYGGADVGVLLDDAARLVDRRLVALEELYAAELRCGRHGVVVGELRELVGEFELRERLYELLMIALAIGGRPAEALEVYQRARRVLVEELGLEPGPALRELERQILAGERVDAPAVLGSAGAVTAGDASAGDASPTDMSSGAAGTAMRSSGGVGGGAAPAQLPHMVRSFVGRTTELAELDQLLAPAGADTGSVAGSAATNVAGASQQDASCGIGVIVGTAGVGKTALAVRWAHRVRAAFPDGQLYVDLHGYGPEEAMTAEEALAWFLRALGVDGNAIPQERAERAARFRTLVAGRRMLVVLDNARSTEDVRALLPGTGSCFVLVTARDSLPGLMARDSAHCVDLDRLSVLDAVELVRQLVGERADAEPEATEAVVHRCARLPLALRVASELIRARPMLGMDDLALELADEQGLLDLLDTEGDPHASVRAVLSWSYHHLPAQSARLFRMLGLHPGPYADGYALAALTGTDLADAHRAAADLVRANLVDRTVDGHFQLHDLLRVYAGELAERIDSVPERRTAVGDLLRQYLHTAAAARVALDPFALPVELDPALPPPIERTFASREDALRWFVAEHANIVEAIRTATDHGWTTIAWQLTNLMVGYFYISKHWESWIHTHQVALAAMDEVDDPLGRGRMLMGLGNAYDDVRRFDEAIACHREAAALLGTVDDRHGAAWNLNNMGVAYDNNGQFSAAVDSYQEAITRFRSAGNPRGIGLALTNLADAHRQLGQFDAARTELDAAMAVLRDGNDTATQRVTLGTLGELYQDMGDGTRAAEHFRKAMEQSLELGDDWRAARMLARLGDVYVDLGDREQAVEHWRRALEIYRELGAADADDTLAKLADHGAVAEA